MRACRYKKQRFLRLSDYKRYETVCGNIRINFVSDFKKFETAQMLTVNKVEYNGRLRKYYHITQEGLNRIEDFKNEWHEIVSIYRFIIKEENDDE